jgi:GMP synthase-like glutamine amidotransferase
VADVRVLSIVHQPDAGTGVFADPVEDLVEWVPRQGPVPDLEGVDAAMVFGGEMHVDQEQANPWLRPEKELIGELLRRGTPVLGVCLGSQLLAEVAGATPRATAEPEIGWRRVEVSPEGANDPLIGPLAPAVEVFEWHSYEAPLPPDGVALARNAHCLQAFRLDGAPAWGIQFHAEVTSADLSAWLDDWSESPDAVGTGQDPDEIRRETMKRIAAQNELGRALASRFLAEAERVTG